MQSRPSRRVPEFIRVSTIIQERIVDGFYAAGEWLPTERDLAAEMTVSRPVIRAAFRHLQDQGFVSQRGRGHRQQVVPAAAPPPVEETPYEARGTIVTIISQSMELASAQSILRGINAILRARESSFQLAVCDTEPDALHHPEGGSAQSWERMYLERVEREGVAGVILFAVGGSRNAPLVKRIQQMGIPVVMIDRYSDEIECDYVGVDNRGGTALAVDHLVELGHRRIGYVMRGEQVSTVQERMQGYRDALDTHGITYDPSLIASAWPTPGPALDHFLGLPEPPTALVAVHDFAAFDIMQEAETRGIHIGKDLSIVGFDDMEAFTRRTGVLTTIRQPFLEIGRRAADLVLSRHQRAATVADRAFRHVILPCTLVVRSSTGPIPEVAD